MNSFPVHSRGQDFWAVIRRVLRRSNIKDDLIEQVFSHEKSQYLYDCVFTHQSAHPHHNYEWLEILGDATVNKCIVWYIAHRFPHLCCPEGVKVIARLKINLISKKTFAECASKLDWWDFIRADEDTKQTKKKKLLEDVFEAFFGATELLLDSVLYPGAGYPICYRIIVSLFQDIHISLRYEDLYDPITRLKELFDYYKDIGSFQFQQIKKDGFQHVTVYQRLSSHQVMSVGYGVAPLLDDAKQKACHGALDYFKRKGIEKPVAEYYMTLQN
jgi:dsRNA-specific ribonuclease